MRRGAAGERCSDNGPQWREGAQRSTQEKQRWTGCCRHGAPREQRQCCTGSRWHCSLLSICGSADSSEGSRNCNSLSLFLCAFLHRLRTAQVAAAVVFRVLSNDSPTFPSFLLLMTQTAKNKRCASGGRRMREREREGERERTPKKTWRKTRRINKKVNQSVSAVEQGMEKSEYRLEV